MTDNYFGKTDIGMVRGNNEDTFIAERVNGHKLITACVIDGVGGYAGGEIAAEIARQSILENMKDVSGNPLEQMQKSFIQANDSIFAAKSADPQHSQMACVLTLALVNLEKNEFHYAHVGDTRLYLFRDHSLIKVSTDHSFVGFLEESGRLSEEAAMRHPKRNEINKALGLQDQLGMREDFIETGQSPFLPGDTLLLCSDGLTDMLDKKQITSILVQEKSLQEKCDLLIKAANDQGGKDNITVVLVNNSKSRVKQSATKPAQKATQKKQPDQSHADPDKNESPVSGKATIAKKKGRSTITILSVLCLLGLTSFLWVLWKDKEKQDHAKKPAQIASKKNPSEVKLQAALNNLVGDTLILSDSIFGSKLLISDTIFINRDSLYLKTSGNLVLQRDSLYAGPAFAISNLAKNIILDSLTFQNFRVAVLSPAEALVLKNTRFLNCGIAVQSTRLFPQNKYISGRLQTDSYQADSIPLSLTK